MDTETMAKKRDKDQEENRKVSLDEFEMVKAIELQKADIIVHNCSKFQITACGCGYGAGNEFGDYFWIKGFYLNEFSFFNLRQKRDFWLFQRCPVVRVRKN